MGSSSNQPGSYGRSAVTYGTAGEFSRIPSDHPIVTVKINLIKIILTNFLAT
jgi:hypothetical protein